MSLRIAYPSVLYIIHVWVIHETSAYRTPQSFRVAG